MIYGITALSVYALVSLFVMYKMFRAAAALIVASMTHEERLNALDGGDDARNAAVLRAHQHMRDRS